MLNQKPMTRLNLKFIYCIDVTFLAKAWRVTLPAADIDPVIRKFVFRGTNPYKISISVLFYKRGSNLFQGLMTYI